MAQIHQAFDSMEDRHQGGAVYRGIFLFLTKHDDAHTQLFQDGFQSAFPAGRMDRLRESGVHISLGLSFDAAVVEIAAVKSSLSAAHVLRRTVHELVEQWKMTQIEAYLAEGFERCLGRVFDPASLPQPTADAIRRHAEQRLQGIVFHAQRQNSRINKAVAECRKLKFRYSSGEGGVRNAMLAQVLEDSTKALTSRTEIYQASLRRMLRKGSRATELGYVSNEILPDSLRKDICTVFTHVADTDAAMSFSDCGSLLWDADPSRYLVLSLTGEPSARRVAMHGTPPQISIYNRTSASGMSLSMECYHSGNHEPVPIARTPDGRAVFLWGSRHILAQEYVWEDPSQSCDDLIAVSTTDWAVVFLQSEDIAHAESNGTLKRQYDYWDFYNIGLRGGMVRPSWELNGYPHSPAHEFVRVMNRNKWRLFPSLRDFHKG